MKSDSNSHMACQSYVSVHPRRCLSRGAHTFLEGAVLSAFPGVSLSPALQVLLSNKYKTKILWRPSWFTRWPSIIQIHLCTVCHIW